MSTRGRPTLKNIYDGSATVQNDRDEWVPAVPLPLFGLRKHCACGAKFWTLAGYRGHYALAHILGTP